MGENLESIQLETSNWVVHIPSPTQLNRVRVWFDCLKDDHLRTLWTDQWFPPLYFKVNNQVLLDWSDNFHSLSFCLLLFIIGMLLGHWINPHFINICPPFYIFIGAIINNYKFFFLSACYCYGRSNLKLRNWFSFSDQWCNNKCTRPWVWITWWKKK